MVKDTILEEEWGEFQSAEEVDIAFEIMLFYILNSFSNTKFEKYTLRVVFWLLQNHNNHYFMYYKILT